MLERLKNADSGECGEKQSGALGEWFFDFLVNEAETDWTDEKKKIWCCGWCGRISRMKIQLSICRWKRTERAEMILTFFFLAEEVEQWVALVAWFFDFLFPNSRARGRIPGMFPFSHWTFVFQMIYLIHNRKESRMWFSDCLPSSLYERGEWCQWIQWKHLHCYLWYSRYYLT